MLTNRSTRRRANANRLTYDNFEPKCLLTGPHQIFVPLPEGTNFVQNSNFVPTTPAANQLYFSNQVPGWTAVQPDQGNHVNQIKLLPYPGIGTVLDLDSSRNSFDQVYQDITTERGGRYLLSFDYRAHPAIFQGMTKRGVDTSNFEVSWNGHVIASVQPNFHWKTMSLEVIGGMGDTSRLMFFEIFEGEMGGGDGVGALINNVRVVRVAEAPVTNSSFDQFGPNRPVNQTNPLSETVPGWNSISPAGSPNVMSIHPTRPHAKTILGSHALNLNAHHQFRDAVFQNLSTEIGAYYYVQIMVQGNGRDFLNVRWDNAWALTVTPNSDWESIGLLVQATSEKTNLMFLEGSVANGDLWIASVKLFRVDAPVVDSDGFEPSSAYRFQSLAFAPFESDSDTNRRFSARAEYR